MRKIDFDITNPEFLYKMDEHTKFLFDNEPRGFYWHPTYKHWIIFSMDKLKEASLMNEEVSLATTSPGPFDPTPLGGVWRAGYALTLREGEHHHLAKIHSRDWLKRNASLYLEYFRNNIDRFFSQVKRGESFKGYEVAGRVITHTQIQMIHFPYHILDVDEEYASTVIDSMNQRKGEMVDMRDTGQSKKRIIFKAPSRGLIGYQSKFLTETRGTGVMNRVFDSYGPFKGDIKGRRNGALISTDSGDAVAYAIFNLQDRGLMFIEPQTKVYGGMIVGEHNRENDLEINVLKGKKLTNVRAAGSDGLVSLTPPVKMSLEEMMAYVNDDELLEVTPQSLRLRKKLLLAHERKRQQREAVPA